MFLKLVRNTRALLLVLIGQNFAGSVIKQPESSSSFSNRISNFEHGSYNQNDEYRNRHMRDFYVPATIIMIMIKTLAYAVPHFLLKVKRCNCRAIPEGATTSVKRYTEVPKRNIYRRIHFKIFLVVVSNGILRDRQRNEAWKKIGSKSKITGSKFQHVSHFMHMSMTNWNGIGQRLFNVAVQLECWEINWHCLGGARTNNQQACVSQDTCVCRYYYFVRIVYHLVW